MRRIGRYIFNGLTVLSLLLCVAACGLWVRSARDVDILQYWGASRYYVYSFSGRLVLYQVHGVAPQDSGWWRISSVPLASQAGRAIACDYEVSRLFPDGLWAAAGFAARVIDFPQAPANPVIVSTPYWAVAVVGSLLPAARALRQCLARGRRQHRHRAGRRPACGYDLRATPARCPECGLALPGPAAAAADAGPMANASSIGWATLLLLLAGCGPYHPLHADILSRGGPREITTWGLEQTDRRTISSTMLALNSVWLNSADRETRDRALEGFLRIQRRLTAGWPGFQATPGMYDTDDFGDLPADADARHRELAIRFSYYVAGEFGSVVMLMIRPPPDQRARSACWLREALRRGYTGA